MARALTAIGLHGMQVMGIDASTSSCMIGEYIPLLLRLLVCSKTHPNHTCDPITLIASESSTKGIPCLFGPRCAHDADVSSAAAPNSSVQGSVQGRALSRAGLQVLPRFPAKPASNVYLVRRASDPDEVCRTTAATIRFE